MTFPLIKPASPAAASIQHDRQSRMRRRLGTICLTSSPLLAQ
jgi:hypothetical protein